MGTISCSVKTPLYFVWTTVNLRYCFAPDCQLQPHDANPLFSGPQLWQELGQQRLHQRSPEEEEGAICSPNQIRREVLGIKLVINNIFWCILLYVLGTSPAKTAGSSANCDSKCYWHVSCDKNKSFGCKMKVFILFKGFTSQHHSIVNKQ